MIIPPFATPRGFMNALQPQGEKEAYWFIFSDDRLLVSPDQRSVPTTSCLSLKKKIYIGTLFNKDLFTGETGNEKEAPAGWLWSNLRTLYGSISDEHYAIAGRALQLIHWDRAHTYCGCCGKETFLRETERCRECSSCGYLAYPKLSPAILALVKKDNKILLARGPHFPEKFYSVIAGYVDPGETLEQCVEREVFEEVGVRVKNIRYFGSQPWPFSLSLMIAFTCDWQEGKISIDPTELTDAAWFDHKNLPQLPPMLSISRMLIDSYLSSKT
jgi:NAD+ diphosphatase